jgi:hypothetical protein
MATTAATPLHSAGSLSTRVQLASAASVPIGTVLVFVGLLVGGYFPPPAAHLTAQEIADFYRHDTNVIRTGLMVASLGFAMWAPLTAAITHHMLRIRPRQNVLAYLQLSAGSAGFVFLIAPLLVLSAAAFRPERDPQITQAVHDLGWILFFMPLAPFLVQSVATGLAILFDAAPRPVFPRWVGYLNLLEAFLFIPIVLLTYFKDGPFAYQGLLVFWVPFIIYFVWLGVMALMIWRAALDEAASGGSEALAFDGLG